jgi:hypothetical protein
VRRRTEGILSCGGRLSQPSLPRKSVPALAFSGRGAPQTGLRRPVAGSGGSPVLAAAQPDGGVPLLFRGALPATCHRHRRRQRPCRAYSPANRAQGTWPPSAHAASASITKSAASHLCQFIAFSGPADLAGRPRASDRLDQARVGRIPTGPKQSTEPVDNPVEKAKVGCEL